MTAPLQDAVELLERSLAYTRGRLAGVRPAHLDRPTPCAGWDLGRLLAHMDDALDAFTEAAAGFVVIEAAPVGLPRVDSLQHKACALLGAWVAAPPAQVRVGDAAMDPVLLVAAAALEITVHGWDVGRSTGPAVPIPEALAGGLLHVARLLVDPAHRAPQFAPPRPVGVDARAPDRLLAWTGRGTEPPRPIPGVRPAHGGLAS